MFDLALCTVALLLQRLANVTWQRCAVPCGHFILICAGTGSSGATIRMYIEKYVAADASEQDLNQETAPALQKLVDVALTLSDLPKLTGRDKPTVIT